MNAGMGIAIAGCGAVTREYYLSALLSRRDKASLLGVYDRDAASMTSVARHFPEARCVDSFEALMALGADLVIVASPPSVHAEQAIAALGAGSHVLCEKPMALGLDAATAMANAARAAGRLLAVNMVRRHLPATRIVERLIATGGLGPLQRIRAFEGGPFRWPIRDQSYFSPAVSGGGILADIGTHIVDLLSLWFEEPSFVRYEDDAMGGLEVNALLHLQCRGVPAVLRLSRDWERPNAVELELERGMICWRAEDITSVELRLTDGGGPMRVEENAAFTFEEAFGAQIDAMVDAIAGGPARLCTAQEALPTVALIERAYRERELMTMPWLQPMEAAGVG